MSINPIVASFWAGHSGDLYVLRVIGPGICRESGRFENLLMDVEVRGPARLIIDLSECPRMDSTFAGAFLRLADRAEKSGFHVLISGAREQVHELLDTLCLDSFFEIVDAPNVGTLQSLDLEDRNMPREQIMELSLDGHERLAALNEANAKRFEALLATLRASIPGKVAGSD